MFRFKTLITLTAFTTLFSCSPVLKNAKIKSLAANYCEPNIQYDYSALNGLGSILFYERDYDAATFFIQRAIDLAKQDGVVYAEALYDLALVRKINKPVPK